MNKRGVALIFSLLAVLVLSILLSSFFFKSVNENNFVSRFVNSVRAFWVAEAGVAQAKRNLPNSPTNGSIASYSYETTTSFRTTINDCNYYDIASTGIVSLPSGGDVRRTIHAVVKTGPVDPTKFQYSIQSANDLCFGGGCNQDPYKYIHPDEPPYCNEHDCYKELDDTINFADLFGYQLNAVSNIATHYTDSNFPGAVSGVNWVDVAPGNTLMVDSTETGSGVLIINGDVHFGGTYTFRGIIYVLGTFEALGTFSSYGSIVVASTAALEEDIINGTPDLYWDQDEIENALNLLASSITSIVSWKEEQ